MDAIYKFVVENITSGKFEKQTAIQMLKLLKQQEQKQDSEEIAIIGMAVRLPNANNTEDFWHNIKNRVDCIKQFPESRRKDIDRYLNFTSVNLEEFKYSEAAYLDDIDLFDNKFFKLSPNEASLMDPCQRLLLETSWQALEDAGYHEAKLNGSNTGVYVGFSNSLKDSYQKMIYDVNPSLIASSIIPNMTALLPSRISYLLDLRGPNMVIDTACSSSLVAVSLACQALRNGDCDMALAGAVKIHTIPLDDDQLKIGIESSDGRTRVFDNNSDGSGIGEGIIVILLKPLAKAKKDRDNIHAIIKGIAINQDGNSIGITAPNPIAQMEVILKAWQNSKIDPLTLSYIEAHGTGTKLGDPIEIEALNNAFQKYTDRKQFCAISAVKSNMGHLYESAGMLNLVKAVLALKHKEIPALIHFKRPNKAIYFNESAVYINTKHRKWEVASSQPRRCGVSSFGISGTNGHLVLEEAPAIEEKTTHHASGWQAFTLSAKSSESLRALIKAFKDYLEQNNNLDLDNICFTVNTGRGRYNYRMSIRHQR